MRKVIKYISFLLAGFLLLIVILLLLTQTEFIREKVKDRLIVEAEKHLNLHFEAQELNGNFYNRLEFRNVKVWDKKKEIGKFLSVRLKYELRPLLSGELLLDSLVIDDPEIRLWQEQDSSWNIASYLKPNPNAPPKNKKPFNLHIRLNSVELNEGNFSIDALANLIPKKVNNFNLSLDAALSGRGVKIDLNELNFNTEEPAINLKELSGIFRMNEEGTLIDSLKIRTELSALDANGNYRTVENMNAEVKADPIAWVELQLFVPGIKLLCSPSVQAKFETVDDALSATVEMRHNNEEVIARVNLNSITKLLKREEPVPYSANLLLHNFSVEHWLEVKNINTRLEGIVDLDGQNVYNFNATTNINANLKNSFYNGITFDKLNLDGLWKNDNISGRLDLSSDFGELAAEGIVQNFSTNKNYSLDIRTEQFDLTAFIPKMKRTILNAHVKAEGQGFDPAKMSTTANLELSGSEIYEFRVDSLNSALSWKNNNIMVDTLDLNVPGARAIGSGRFNIDSLFLFTRVNAKIDSLTLIDHLVQLPVTFDSVRTVSQVKGPVKRLAVQGQVELFNARGYNAALNKTSANYLVQVHPDSLLVKVQAEGSQAEYSDVPFDSLNVDLHYMNKELDLTGHIDLKDTLAVDMKTSMLLGDTMVVSIPEFKASTLLSDYYLQDTLRAVLIGKDKLQLSNLHLLDAAEPDFILSANGTVSATDTNSFYLLVKELHLDQFNRFIPGDDSINGVLGTDVVLKGRAKDPVVEGKVEITNPGYGQYKLNSLNGKFGYKDRQASAGLELPDLGSSFHANASAAFDAYIDSFRFVFSEPDTFNAELSFDSLKISRYVKNFIENDTLRGLLNANLKARGTFKTPQIYGHLDLDHVKYQNKKLGLDFSDMKASLGFDGNKVSIDTMFIRQRKGFVSISGNLAFDSTIIAGNIVSSSLEANADNFLIAKNRNYEILFDASTFLKTGAQNPEFGGKIKVLRSDVFLPAILTREIQNDEEDVPMLVEAAGLDNDTLLVDTELETKKKKNAKSVLDNITGRMNLEIPRNTWLRSNDMRVELSGEVDVVKNGPYFELFGDIELIRGHYILYGKKLDVKTSRIIFNGGKELNPTLNFTAEYVFRGSSREKRYLELLVTGTLKEPKINFMLDDVEITENDGISVLLFGSTSDEIGFGEQNGIISSIGSNAVASLITSQLSKTIGTHLNIDMIEITATENWKSAAFVVGKYITNNIFVIYERGFGEVEGDEIVPETFTVEYELNDKLFLRLQSGSSITSGVDVVLKFEEKKK